MENYRNFMALKVILGSNPTEQQQLGAANCASRDNDFTITVAVEECLVESSILIGELNSGCPWLQLPCIRNGVSETWSCIVINLKESLHFDNHKPEV
uniref:Uncharacterized protein n=1 Tax=Oryza punctata TaxID=4537 RepID=A0A0E0M0E1_ORYPU